jgi:hypothetical protein
MDPSQQILLRMLNQLFELEKKVDKLEARTSLNRNLKRLKEGMEELGLSYENPLGEPYDETRTDCDASISGSSTDNLYIVEVIKPIVFQQVDGVKQMIQRGVVIVEGKGKWGRG